MSIIRIFVEHNRKIFGAVQHSIIGYFLSIIGSALVSEQSLLYVLCTRYNASTHH